MIQGAFDTELPGIPCDLVREDPHVFDNRPNPPTGFVQSRYDIHQLIVQFAIVNQLADRSLGAVHRLAQFHQVGEQLIDVTHRVDQVLRDFLPPFAQRCGKIFQVGQIPFGAGADSIESVECFSGIGER